MNKLDLKNLMDESNSDDDVLLDELLFKNELEDDEEEDPDVNNKSHRSLLTSLETVFPSKKVKRSLRPQELRETLIFPVNSQSSVLQQASLAPLFPTKEGIDDEVKTKTAKNQSIHINDLINDDQETEAKKLKKKKLLQKPLEVPVLKKLSRKAAFEEISSKLTQKWGDVVQTNRIAKHLEFPLQDGEVVDEDRGLALNDKRSRSVMTDMEIKIHQLIDSSGNKLADSSVLTESEKQLLSQLTKEEAEQRTKELAKMRALLSFQEAKLKRQSKIKSRNYRRIRKREKLREAVKNIDVADPESIAKQLEDYDKSRALERISLRHRKTGKFAKSVAIKRKFDENARNDVQETLRLGRKLLEKRHQEESDSDEEDFGSEVENIQEEDQERINNKEDEQFFPPSSAQFNPWFKQTSEHNEEAPNKKRGIVLLRSCFREEGDTDSEDGSGNKNQKELMREAFAEDDVVVDLEREKKEQDKSFENEDQEHLPGWGSWTGVGRGNASRRVTKIKNITKKSSSNNPPVIFNVSTVASKKRVKQVPFPFNNTVDYESGVLNATPIGRNFVPESAFRVLTKPAVTTKKGSIIEPITLDNFVVKKDSVNKCLGSVCKKRKKHPVTKKLSSKKTK